ncbi:hypothetical protein F5884DRAFT_730028 [Xylogone sp. PMI_703]|nr:hypothetical protein F5884DRAFT_730028 [Xylogone sp. PMI_703]
MLGYNGRTSPNALDLMANLDNVLSTQELANDDNNFGLEEDLALFTNIEFFDFGFGHDTDLQVLSTTPNRHATEASPKAIDTKPFDFLQGEFDLSEFNSWTQQRTITYDDIFHGSSSDSWPPTSSPYTATTSTVSPSKANTSQQSIEHGEKHKADAPGILHMEEASRLVAEEDKRRRNTAASARFRIKKKQREQALEESAKQMSGKVAALEDRINMLETENKWLKNLITQKNKGQGDISVLLKKWNQESSTAHGIQSKGTLI